MSFELTNALTTFQIYINRALIELINVICVIYLNDILIYSSNRKSHVKHVRKILKHFRKYNFYAKLSKCDFFVENVEYLEFMITRDDIAINTRRVDIVRN